MGNYFIPPDTDQFIFGQTRKKSTKGLQWDFFIVYSMPEFSLVDSRAFITLLWD